LRTCEVDVGCSVLCILCVLEVEENAINVFLLPKIQAGEKVCMKAGR
jgi:hypothetical protein